MTERQMFRLVADLKAAADEKDACGQRVLAWYADIAAGFRKPVSPG